MDVRLRSDGTSECPECGLPRFPIAVDGGMVALECANRHRAMAPLPSDAAQRRVVRSWVARKGAQLHTQHERWETEDDEGD